MIHYMLSPFCSPLQLYFQIEPEVGLDSIKLKALADLFDEIVQEPLFNQLRLFFRGFFFFFGYWFFVLSRLGNMLTFWGKQENDGESCQ